MVKELLRDMVTHYPKRVFQNFQIFILPHFIFIQRMFPLMKKHIKNNSARSNIDSLFCNFYKIFLYNYLGILFIENLLRGHVHQGSAESADYLPLSSLG